MAATAASFRMWIWITNARPQTNQRGGSPPLEQRIADFRRGLDNFIRERALEIQKGTGLPLPMILQLLDHNLRVPMRRGYRDRGHQKTDA